MLSSLLKTLAHEQIFLVGSKENKLPFLLDGIVRLIDSRGKTVGLVLDKETLDELEEDLESQNPAFLASLEKSRHSPQVSSKEVKRKAGLDA